MPYQPGPLRQLPPDDFAFDVVNYDFTDDVSTMLVDFDASTVDYDLGMLDVITWRSDIDDPIPDVDLGAALVEIALQEAFPVILDEPGLIGALSNADVLLSAATAAAPVEAWTDPPEPFAPPLEGITLPEPQIPPGAFTPGGVAAPVPTQGAPGGTGRTLALTNITVYGNPNFVVTDEWLVQATGTPGDDVSVHAYLNGADIGSESLGSIGADGRFETGGFFTPDDVGVWKEDWTVGGQPTTTYNFLVTSAS